MPRRKKRTKHESEGVSTSTTSVNAVVTSTSSQKMKKRKPERENSASTKQKKQNNKKSRVKKDNPKEQKDAQAAKPIHNQELRRIIKRNKENQEAAQKSVESMDVLLPEEAGYLESTDPMINTYKFSQREIRQNVDKNTSAKIFDLSLSNFGSYRVNYTRNGKYMLLGAEKGHVAMINAQTLKAEMEIHLREKVQDIHFLNNESLFATAQQKYVYIYDNRGAEVHCLKKHINPQRLSYLPYHYLIASVGKTGYLKYQDVSSGQLIAEHRTRLGSCSVLAQNPYNGVLCCGHANGSLTMWTPNMNEYVVKMLCHDAPIQAASVDISGKYLVTSGLDGTVKVFDIRTFKKLHSYFTNRPACDLDISQRELLAVGFGSYVQIWKDAFVTKASSPYMRHKIAGSQIKSIRFRPYEDVLGIGHSKGFSSIVIPGSGEANFDTFEANPYETGKTRRENNVHKLLDKLPASTIALNPDVIGNIDRAPKEIIARERELAWAANNPSKKKKEKKKMRGRNKAGKIQKKKRQNVITKERLLFLESLEKRRREKESKNESKDLTDEVFNRFNNRTSKRRL